MEAAVVSEEGRRIGERAEGAGPLAGGQAAAEASEAARGEEAAEALMATPTAESTGSTSSEGALSCIAGVVEGEEAAGEEGEGTAVAGTRDEEREREKEGAHRFPLLTFSYSSRIVK